jgi:hypothetical protein
MFHIFMDNLDYLTYLLVDISITAFPLFLVKSMSFIQARIFSKKQISSRLGVASN